MFRKHQETSTKGERPMSEVRKADCCKHCKNTLTDFIFRDAILCSKINKYQEHTEVCDLYEDKEKEQ